MSPIAADSDPDKTHLRPSAKSAVSSKSDGMGLSLFFDDLLDALVVSAGV
jgi:hypothetical protein